MSPPSRPGKRRRGLSKWKRPLSGAAVLLVALSLFQYATRGEVTWHTTAFRTLVERVGSYATRPEASWKQAAGALEVLGEHREGRPAPRPDFSGRVVGVLDGDSIIVLDSGGEERTIRLFGIDAPERWQPHADKSRAALTRRLAKQSVGLVVHDRDRYGRLVATVYLDDVDINLEMVEAGHAWWYRRYAPHDHLLELAEQEAREAARGLWANPDPVPPWDWRRTRTGA